MLMGGKHDPSIWWVFRAGGYPFWGRLFGNGLGERDMTKRDAGSSAFADPIYLMNKTPSHFTLA